MYGGIFLICFSIPPVIPSKAPSTECVLQVASPIVIPLDILSLPQRLASHFPLLSYRSYQSSQKGSLLPSPVIALPLHHSCGTGTILGCTVAVCLQILLVFLGHHLLEILCIHSPWIISTLELCCCLFSRSSSLNEYIRGGQESRDKLMRLLNRKI